MLTLSAHPRNAISRPEKGRTGQKPLRVMKPAIMKETAHTLPKNSNAARTLSEQWGQISMRCGSGCTEERPSSLSGVGFRWYCRTFFIQVKNLLEKVGAPGVRRGER